MRLLLLGAVGHEQADDDRVRVDHAGERHPAVCELLDDRRIGDEVETETAVLDGDRDPEEAERLHLLDHGLGVLVGALEPRDGGGHLTCDEPAHRRHDLAAHLGVGRL